MEEHIINLDDNFSGYRKKYFKIKVKDYIFYFYFFLLIFYKKYIIIYIENKKGDILNDCILCE